MENNSTEYNQSLCDISFVSAKLFWRMLTTICICIWNQSLVLKQHLLSPYNYLASYWHTLLILRHELLAQMVMLWFLSYNRTTLQQDHFLENTHKRPSISLEEFILCMRPANERQRYIVTSSPIGWAHTQNDPWPHVLLCFDRLYCIDRLYCNDVWLYCHWFEDSFIETITDDLFSAS